MASQTALPGTLTISLNRNVSRSMALIIDENRLPLDFSNLIPQQVDFEYELATSHIKDQLISKKIRRRFKKLATLARDMCIHNTRRDVRRGWLEVVEVEQGGNGGHTDEAHEGARGEDIAAEMQEVR